MSPRRRAFRKWSFVVLHPLQTRRHVIAVRGRCSHPLWRPVAESFR